MKKYYEYLKRRIADMKPYSIKLIYVTSWTIALMLTTFTSVTSGDFGFLGIKCPPDLGCGCEMNVLYSYIKPMLIVAMLFFIDSAYSSYLRNGASRCQSITFKATTAFFMLFMVASIFIDNIYCQGLFFFFVWLTLGMLKFSDTEEAFESIENDRLTEIEE